MAVTTTAARTQYIGSGVTSVFSIPFFFLENAELAVYVTSEVGTTYELSSLSDFTAVGAGEENGGSLTLLPGSTFPVLPVGYLLTIYRVTNSQQETRYENMQGFPPKTHELTIDKAFKLIQELYEITQRCLKFNTLDSNIAAAVTDLGYYKDRLECVIFFDKDTGQLRIGRALDIFNGDLAAAEAARDRAEAAAEAAEQSEFNAAQSAEDAHNDALAVSAWHEDIEGWHTDVDLWRADVLSWHEDVEIWRQDVSLMHADVLAWHTDISFWHDDVATWWEDVDTWKDEAAQSAQNAAQSESNAAQSAINAAASAALIDPLRMARAGGLTFNGVGSGGYATLPDINLAGGQIGIFFVYRKMAASTGNTAGIITRARVGLSADGGWSILDRLGVGGEQYVTVALNDSRFTGADARPNWPLTLSDLPVGSVSTWGFNFDNSGDPADLDLEFFLNGASQGQRTATGSDAYRDSALARTHIATSTALSAFSALGISGLVIANRVITPTEYAELHASAGAIVPVTLRNAVTDYYPCDDGNSYQCRNMVSGGQPMVLSQTGVTHDIARTPWTLSASRTGSGWLDGDRPTLDAGAEIEYASVECSAAGTVSLGYNSANDAVHFTATHPGGGARIRVPIADTSPGVADRRLYLAAPAGATVNVHLSGNIR